MPYKPSDPYVKRFATSHPATGAAVNADALPVATAALAGSGTGAMALTVANVGTGLYEVTGTFPATRAKGDVLNVSVAATVAGVAGVGVVDNQVLDSKRAGDLNDYAGGDTAGTTTLVGRLTATRATNLDNLDAFVSSRSTYAGADTSGTTALLSRLTAGRATNLDNLAGGPVALAAQVPAAFTAATFAAAGVFAAAALANAPTGGGSGVDPWATTLPGPYGPGTAGAILGGNLDAKVSSRSTYAGADTPGTTVLVGRLSAARANNLDFLDASVATRSTYGGGDTTGTTTLVGLLTPARAAKIDFLDAAVTTRSTYAGGDTAGTTTLVGRLTAGRATNLDNLAGGAVALAAQIPAQFTAATFAAAGVFSTGALANAPTGGGAAAPDPWGTPLPGGYGPGTAGAILGGNPDTAGTTALLGRLTAGRATNLDFLDVSVASRSTYAGADTAGTTTLLGRLTGPRATNLDFLDAAVSSRSTYAGADTAGTTALLSRLTAPRAGYLDNLSGGSVALAAQIPTQFTAATFSGPGVFAAAALANAPAAADAWAKQVPGTYPDGSAGSILGRFLDAAVSSRSTYAGADTAGTTTLLGLLTPARAARIDNLDAAVSSRSTYAGGDTAGTTTLVSRLTAPRATNLDNLDASVATRSTYGGGDTPGTTTLVGRVTALRATNLDFLDVSVASRSTYLGADTPGTSTLLTLLTPPRAGYLDNLAGGLVALRAQIPAQFTAALFAAPGVFAAGALVNVPLAADLTPQMKLSVTAAVGLANPNLDAQLAGIASTLGGTRGDTSTLVGLLTPVRAGYLDHLAVTPFPANASQFSGSAASQVGALATQATLNTVLTSVQSITNNARVINLFGPSQLPTPASGSSAFEFDVVVTNPATGALGDADAVPTVAARSATGGDYRASLSPVAPGSSAGRYKFTFTVPSTATPDEVVFEVSAAVNGQPAGTSLVALVAPAFSSTFTTQDRATLNAVAAVQPPYPIQLDEYGWVILAEDQPGCSPATVGDLQTTEENLAPLVLPTGTVLSATSTASLSAAGGSLVASNGAYNRQSLRFRTGDLATERRRVLAHTVAGTLHQFVLSNGFTGLPGEGDEFDIL